MYKYLIVRKEHPPPSGTAASKLDEAEAAQSGFMTSSASARNRNEWPGKFDPTKSGLLGYLERAAERDLINVVQQGHRRRRGEELREDVEVSILARNCR